MSKITVEEAKSRVLSTMPKRIKGVNGLTSQNVVEYIKTLDDNVFMFKKNSSYVLSPADDELEPIIGEFDEIPEDDSMPPCLKDWINTYSREIEEFLLPKSSETLFIDLGLSVMWATKNLGAETPEDVGNYYAWGELNEKTEYTWKTYKYYTGKKVIDIGNDISKNLDYDAAYVLDKSMYIPTKELFQELIDKCIWKKLEKGFKVQGPNGNSIYIPINGCISESSTVSYTNSVYCWTSNLNESNKNQAVTFKTLETGDTPSFYNMYRRTGAAIRPVVEKKELPYNFVDLGLSVNWSDRNLGAEKDTDFGNYYAWGEIEVKDSYLTSNYKYYDGSNYQSIGTNISKTEHDAAYNISKNMCLPTEALYKELIEKCTWTKVIKDGVNGWEVKGPNGNIIFMPINGCYSNTDKIGYVNYAYYLTSNNSTNSYACKSLRITTSPAIFSLYRRTGAGIRPVSVTTNNSVRKNIDPLIPYRWSQTAPYNNLLPKDPSTGKTSVTGCSNTAAAQIMAYWGCLDHNNKKYRRGCTKTEPYTSVQNGIKINIPALDPIKIFDYDNLKFTTSEINKSQDYKNAVATLMKYIGYASKANYTSGGTGTSVSQSATTFKNKLRLGSKLKLIYEKTDKENFEELIYQNLLKGWPVFMAGWSSNGAYAHSFVCDGYDNTTGKFHFNWGWGGSYDGWFELKSLVFSTHNYSYSKRAIINIHPEYVLGDTDEDGEVTTQDVLNVVKSVANNEYSENQDINSDEKVTLDDALDLIDIIVSKKSSK